MVYIMKMAKTVQLFYSTYKNITTASILTNFVFTIHHTVNTIVFPNHVACSSVRHLESPLKLYHTGFLTFSMTDCDGKLSRKSTI